MRLIFMGTPDFSVGTLDALIAAGHEIGAVYTQPPRPAGRGKQLRPSPVHMRAQELGLEVRHPVSLKGADEQTAFAALDAEAAVVVAYGLILPLPVLNAPKRGCFNVHASLLPRWRGAAPIQRAIEAGDALTGVTIMQMEQGLDTGPMLLKGEVAIGRMTAGELHDQLAAMGARLMVEALARLDALPAQPQDDALATHAAKIDKAEARIDWARPASQLERTVRALSPFPGACSNLRASGSSFSARNWPRAKMCRERCWIAVCASPAAKRHCGQNWSSAPVARPCRWQISCAATPSRRAHGCHDPLCTHAGV